jgi:hypothetical protein
VSIYITKIQIFVFDAGKEIFVAEAKLKEYCRKVIVANSSLKVTYPDAVLFLILSRSLPASLKPLTHAFIARPTLSIAVKINMLVEHEMDIRNEETTTEEGHIVKSSAKVSKYCHQRSDSESEEGSSIKCYLCDGDHAFRFCNHIKLTGKLLK